MKKAYLSIPLFTCILFCACDKYVDNFTTKGSLTATGITTYRNLLNNTQYFEETTSLPDFSSDDILFADQEQQQMLNSSSFYYPVVQAYTWGDQYYNSGTPDRDWNTLYRIILYCNTVLDELPKTAGNDSTKQELTAEARVHRADAYLTLVNMYGKAYNTATASKDPGVPLLTQVTFDQKLVRGSIQQAYDLIFSDLHTALPSLPAMAAFNSLPSKVAAYALLARAYLLTGNYDQAKSNAQQALAIKNSLIDYNNYITAQYPPKYQDAEILLSKISSQRFSNSGAEFLRLNDALVNLWGPTDLRYQVMSRPGYFFNRAYTGRFYFKEIVSGSTRNTGPCVPEVMLIAAEAMARTGDAAGAIGLLNQLRQKRFKPADYVPYTATTADVALQLALDERRRELFCHGSRWFDQKRLNTEVRFATIVQRSFMGTTYTLDPGANRYLYPIANYYFQYSPDLLQNPR